MSRMLMVTDVQDSIKRHQAQIITSLKDPDIRLTLITLSVTSNEKFIVLDVVSDAYDFWFLLCFPLRISYDYKKTASYPLNMVQMYAQCFEYLVFMRMKLNVHRTLNANG